jgi:Spy/CpxP family protein refolding chaperone
MHPEHHMGLSDSSKRFVIWRNTADRARHYRPLNEPGGFRKMKKAATTLLLATIFFAPAIFAQGPDGPGGGNNVQRRVAFLTDRLSLSSAQQTQITAILNAGGDANSTTSRASMKAAHDTLNTAVQANDSAAMEQAATMIGSLTAQSTLARAKTDAAIYKVLTPEQRAKYSQMQQDMGMGRGGPRGRGGRGGEEGGAAGGPGDPGPGY